MAVLPVTVQLLMVGLLSQQWIPPPVANWAELFVIVQPLMIGLLFSKQPIAAPKLAELPEIVQPRMVGLVPQQPIPPPAFDQPPVIVRF